MKYSRNAHSVITVLILGMALILGLSACATSPNARSADCASRRGHCFDAIVSGQPVIPLQSRALIEPFAQVSHYVADVEWQLAKPISGPITVQIAPNQAGQTWLGSRGQQRVQVVPLGNYELESRQVLMSRDDVRIGGQAATTVSNVLESDTLPPGNYLLRITARGNNWDRKTIFIVVR